VRLDHAELVAHRKLDHDRRNEHDQGHLRGPVEGLDVLLLAQVPGGHREHDEAPGDQRGQDHVRVAPDERRVDEQGPDILEHRLTLLVHPVADRVLHPRVGDEDE
jgi:hypothetical protein